MLFFFHRHALVTGDDLRLLSRYVTSGGFHEGDTAWIYDDALVLPAFPTHGTDETLVTAWPEAVSMSNDCLRNVPVFTTDTAPSDGILVFRIQLGGEAHRRDTEILKWWNVTAGQQINNDIVSNVPAPRWARLWWYPSFDFTWYLLPPQYWQGDGMTASLYGVACKPAVQPPYHTSFSAAIAEDQLPHRPCTTTPTLVNPPNGAMLDTLIPIFEWDNSNEPGAIELSLEIAKDPDFAGILWTYRDHSLLHKEFRSTDNLEASTTYYWRVFFVCNETKGPPHEVREFTTGSGGVILPAPNLISPPDASTISSETVFLQWEAVDGAVEYLVKWGESDQRGRWYQWVSDTQYQVGYDLHPNASYEWRVAARNDYAIGEFATRQFTTSPSNVASVTPTNTHMPAPTDTPTPQATLNLRAGPGTQYRIVGQLRDGDALTIRGKNNEAGDWLQVVTANGTEGWVSVADIPIVPTPLPPSTQAPIPPPPSPEYPFESGTMGWEAQRGAQDTQAVTAVAQSSVRAYSGWASLELAVDLIGGNHPTNSKGEAFVDMRYNLPTGMTTPAPYDLTGKTITCWVYAPPGSAGDPSSPNGFQVFVKDTDFDSEYGTWENITPEREGTWFPIALTPSTQTPPRGYKDPGFDPAGIILLGVKMGAGGLSTSDVRYSGPVYVDACSW